MKNILNLFRPSPTEQQLEAELSGTTLKYVPRTSNPPKRGTSSNLPEAGADELHQLRASLQDIEARLASSNHERAKLEAENSHLKKSLDETGRMLSAQIASSGLSAPVPEATDTEPEPKGLQRSIQAAKAEASRTNHQPLTRPTL